MTAFTKQTLATLSGSTIARIDNYSRPDRELLPFVDDAPSLRGGWRRFNLEHAYQLAIMEAFAINGGCGPERASSVTANVWEMVKAKGLDLHNTRDADIWGGAVRHDVGEGIYGGGWFVGPLTALADTVSKFESERAKHFRNLESTRLELVNLSGIVRQVHRRAKEAGIEVEE